MMTHRIGNSEVKVISGDICESKCEVIVSSDDSRLTQGGGVSRAIARAGGADIRRQIGFKRQRCAVVCAGSVEIQRSVLRIYLKK